MAEGLYRIGECIFMEVYPPPMPYQICKIEELRKNSKGSVEVAAKCFYRRKDLPTNLLAAADRHAMAMEEEGELDPALASFNNFDKLSELQLHLVRHRELFLSRQIETYKIDMVRGKCMVSLLNELEDISSYLQREDAFFYTMVYDPNQKTLLVDKGEIRTGQDYQAEIPPYIPPEERDDREHPAVQVWQPNCMPDHKVEQFLVVARSIGTFARALLDGAKKPQISLRLGAAAASRDITLFHAMDTLHDNEYDITKATACLVPRGPVLCADELEAWTQEEAKRFEDGLQEQKDFLYIQKKYLPWKPVKSIVAYYYMWKTTDRYQIQKRHRMIEKQNDLKEVIVHLRTPTGTAPGPRDLSGKAATSGVMPKAVPESMVEVPLAADGEKGCESCFVTTATRWYQWGPAHEHCRLCNLCYTYWRKYGGLKLPTRWETADRRLPSAASVPPAITAVPSAIQMRRTKSSDHLGSQIRIGKKSGGRRDRRDRDVVPPLPFVMKPNNVSVFVRHKLGMPALLKAARSPFVPVDLKDIEKPSSEVVSQFVSVRSRRRKRPKLESTLSSLKHSLQQSPMKPLILRPSRTPISPSYKKTAIKQASKGKVTSSGTYIPPKTGSHAVPEKASRPVENSHIATAGLFVPPSTTDGTEPLKVRKRKLPSDADCPKPTKIARPSSPIIVGAKEIFFKIDKDTKLARRGLGRHTLYKAARSPAKPINY